MESGIVLFTLVGIGIWLLTLYVANRLGLGRGFRRGCEVGFEKGHKHGQEIHDACNRPGMEWGWERLVEVWYLESFPSFWSGERHEKDRSKP
jgi:hypothetical protein